jgi:tRNA(Ile)-lysidine synthase
MPPESLPPSLLNELALSWPAAQWQNVTVLVAVSGGADSVALLRGLSQLRQTGDGRVIVAHFNHRLRGSESDGDETFVRQLASKLDLPVVVAAATDNLRQGGGEGLESLARQARYGFFKAAAAEYGARYVATAHTADDQVETVLFNILRGTGLTGLAGIPRVRQLSEATSIVRPLGNVSRSQVLAYLQAIAQNFREDSSNASNDFTRNRLRHELLPQLERDYNPSVREAIHRLARIADETNGFLSVQAETALSTSARPISNGLEFDLTRFAHLHPILIRQALLLAWQELGWPLQDMSHEKWRELQALVQAKTPPPPADLPGGVRVSREQNKLRLSRGPSF